MRGISETVVARVAAGPTRAPVPVRAGVSRWNVRNRICKAIVAGATALSLAASALATAEPAAAQWSGGHGGTQGQGVPIIIGPRQTQVTVQWVGRGRSRIERRSVLADSPNLFRLWRLAQQ